MNNNFDKPLVPNTAYFMNPVKSQSDFAADKLKNKILKSKDAILPATQVWYVSEDGNDDNKGNSPECPWKTLAALKNNREKIGFGDAVLLRRGDVFRGNIETVNGVYYGAYGNGDKPCVYESEKNYANSLWEHYEKDLWRVDIKGRGDIGIVVFNHGEKVGLKKKTLDMLLENGDFYCEAEYLWLRMDVKPSDFFYSIEMGALNHIFFIGPDGHDVTIENITIKYGGGMGVRGCNGAKNITVKNCEVGWCGGCYLPNYKDGKVRFGNGIEFWRGCENITVENCWVYQIYDSGLSHQGNGEFIEKNITFKNNLIEYCSFASIEYWLNDANINSMENIIYEGNILRFSGYGWGDLERPNIVSYHIFSSGEMDHKCKNFIIRNNIMDLSTQGLIKCTSKIGTLPTVTGNTYIQKFGGILGTYGAVDSKIEEFDNNALKTIQDKFGDTMATVKSV